MNQTKRNITEFKSLVFDAAQAIKVGNYDKSIAIYKKALIQQNNDLALLRSIAKCYDWNGNLENAFRFANRALAINPNDFDMLLLVCKYWFEMNNEEKTYKYACKIISAMPESLTKGLKLAYWIIKPLSTIFKNLGGTEKKIASSLSDHETRNVEFMIWAKGYKEWYETKNNSEID